MTRQLGDAEIDLARQEVRDWMKSRPDITAAHIAQHTTLSDSTVRAWIAGGFPGGHQVVDGILSAVRKAKAGDILGPGGREAVVLTDGDNSRVGKLANRGRFYATQTARRIFEVLEYCAENNTIGVATAAYGAGKTEAVREWQRRTAGKVVSNYFEFDEFASTNKVDLVRCMGRMYGIDTNVGSQNGGPVFRELCNRIRQNPGLLIFDQCETLRPRVCQVLRQIHDRTADAGVGMVMLAAPSLLERLVKMVDLGALASRVGIFAPLTGITRAEMAAIVKQEGITDMEESAFNLWYTATGGSMRRLMRSIDLLTAKHAGKRVTERTMEGVAGHLWGLNLGRAVAA
jgi:DNA transposition AAA+ family ATPase